MKQCIKTNLTMFISLAAFIILAANCSAFIDEPAGELKVKKSDMFLEINANCVKIEHIIWIELDNLRGKNIIVYIPGFNTVLDESNSEPWNYEISGKCIGNTELYSHQQSAVIKLPDEMPDDIKAFSIEINTAVISDVYDAGEFLLFNIKYPGIEICPGKVETKIIIKQVSHIPLTEGGVETNRNPVTCKIDSIGQTANVNLSGDTIRMLISKKMF